jgi:Ca-activated chloride channel family protein
MKDRSVAEQLEKLEAPKPRAEARLAARNAALVEFARAQARESANGQPAQEQPTPEQAARQGFWSRFRLSRDDSRHGSSRMKWELVSRTAYGAVASGCVAAFALAVMWPMFRNQDVRQGALPAGYETTVDLQHPGQKKDQQSRAQPQPQLQGLVADPAPPEFVVDEPMAADTAPVPELKYSMPPAPAESYRNTNINEVVVTGERRTLQSTVDAKREAVGVVDAISSEEIGQGPDQGNAESLQRFNRVAGDARLPKATGIPTRGQANQPVLAAKLSGGLVFVAPQPASPYFEAKGDDKFQHFEVNPIKRVIGEDAVSTFSVDVDTASYSFARRMINEGRLPQKDAVRVEEMINYFDYAWPKPDSRKTPFAATIAVSDSPWTKGKKLVHIGIKGYDIDRNEVPDANLVFLMDVSGSMNSPDKLPLAVQSMKLLLQRLKPTDTVGIVVYAGAAGLVLEPTAVKDEDKIIKALDSLQPGGSTAGAEGIELAYQLAEKSFRKGGVNRVMLATDGDFNVGIDNTEELKSFIERKREKGIFLSVLGFGEGNYRDELAQALAQNGNGVAAYIDTIAEAKKVLVEQSTGSLFTIAKDVKLQVEFNPRTVAEYRLVGYETRALKREDFNNDKIDAGDVGAGHTVTALYEITPVGSPAVSVDPMRYQPEGDFDKGILSGSRNEYGFLKIRYKLPNEDTSTLVTQPIPLETRGLAAVIQREVNFSTAVAGFAQLLKGGAYTGKLTYEDVIAQAQNARGEDRNGYRAEFVDLVRKAQKAKGM